MRCWPFVLLLSILLTTGRAISQQATATKALHDLFAASWDYDMQQRPDDASEQGDRRWNDRWPDKSLEAYARRNQHHQDVLDNLAKIGRKSLSPVDQLNYELFQKRMQE